ncbi:hypothetical protein ACIOHR_37190 [Streptomyces anulatus]
MKAELDPLATALNGKDRRPAEGVTAVGTPPAAIGRAPQLADAELVTLAMTQATPGFPAEGKPSSALNHLLIVSE